MISIKKGKIFLYRLHDIGWSIDLTALETLLKGDARRMKFNKIPNMKVLEIPNPPVSMEMKSFEKMVFGSNMNVGVIAKAFDFGVLSISFVIEIPPSASIHDIEETAFELDNDTSLDSKAIEYIHSFLQIAGDTVKNISIKKEFAEYFTAYLLEDVSPPADSADFGKVFDPSRLILCEKNKVSHMQKEEININRFSYFPSDLVVLHTDSALVIEPSDSTDVLDILEFAKAQLLELRYYDKVLDKELADTYSEVSEKRDISIWNIRTYERAALKLSRTVMDITEVKERVNVALKVTEDAYYAKIYRRAMVLFRSRELEESIKGKLDALTDYYKIIYNDIATKRGHLLELGIIILIIIEIIMLPFL
ncbi:MAG: hypothetical protein OEY64_04885 [Nitrospinota bacterium]|nr:hypothetical protein [Nitrospinota bacterium]